MRDASQSRHRNNNKGTPPPLPCFFASKKSIQPRLVDNWAVFRELYGGPTGREERRGERERRGEEGRNDVPPTSPGPPRRWLGSTLLASRRARWEKTGSSPGEPLRLASILPRACRRSGKSREGGREGGRGGAVKWCFHAWPASLE